MTYTDIFFGIAISILELCMFYLFIEWGAKRLELDTTERIRKFRTDRFEDRFARSKFGFVDSQMAIDKAEAANSVYQNQKSEYSRPVCLYCNMPMRGADSCSHCGAPIR